MVIPSALGYGSPIKKLGRGAPVGLAGLAFWAHFVCPPEVSTAPGFFKVVFPSKRAVPQ